MAYETTLTITLNVDGGPPAMKETSKIDGVAGVFSKRVSFCSSTKVLRPTQKRFEHDGRKLIEQEIQFGSLVAGETISFISIKATRYTYKRCSEKVDPAGVGYSLESCSAAAKKAAEEAKKPAAERCSLTPCVVNFIRNEKVLVNFPGCDQLSNIHNIYVYIDEELFDCSKKDPDEIILTVTWGVVSEEEKPEAACTAGC